MNPNNKAVAQNQIPETRGCTLAPILAHDDPTNHLHTPSCHANV